MKNIIKLEEFGFFLMTLFFFHQAGIAWWWFLVLLLLPDISMAAYAFGPVVGAKVYNFFHHRGLAILLMAAGWYLHKDVVYIIGTILLAHASLDRIFGYGLKYFSGFKHTHLGDIGKQ
jgi:hypothetical protein